MSLLNAWITPDEAIVAVDSDGVDREGEHKTLSKLLTIPALPAVLAMRGSNVFLANVFHLCVLRCFDSFDALLGDLPGILQFADVTLPAHLRDPKFPDVELVAIGWSHEQSRVLGRLYAKRGDAEEFTAKDTEGFIAPYDAETMADIPTAVESLAAIARAQVRYMRRMAGLGGGRLVVANISRDAVSVHHGMEFETEREMYADTRPAA